jgi:hypothetical protein
MGGCQQVERSSYPPFGVDTKLNFPGCELMDIASRHHILPAHVSDK